MVLKYVHTYVGKVQIPLRKKKSRWGQSPFGQKRDFQGKSSLLSKNFSKFFFSSATLNFIPNDALSLRATTIYRKNGREMASPKVSENHQKKAKNLETATTATLLRARLNYYPILVHHCM